MRQERRVWFAPRRVGWGWTPVAWQGWAIVAAHIVVTTIGARALERTYGEAAAVGFVVWLSLLLLVVCFATGVGPGGPTERAAYDRQVRAGRPRPPRPDAPPLTPEEVRERLQRGRP